MSYQKLDWDSEFFGLPVGRLPPGPLDEERLEKAITAAEEDGIACLYLLVPISAQERLHLALASGFLPYDVRVELDRPLDGEIAAMDGGARAAGVDDLSTLERLARGTFDKTRFFADPGFPAQRVPELYARWARRGVETFPQRRTFLADGDEGFVTCHFDQASGAGAIELLSVAGNAAGRGVGNRLIRVANAAFAQAGLHRATVVTQGRNVAAQRLYQHNGYRTRRLDVWLHRWSPPRESSSNDWPPRC